MFFLGFPVPALWIAFAVLWIFTPSTLGHIQHWIASIPLAAEVILWIVFLPWVGSLWIWHSSLALWLRILLIVVIALATISMFNGRQAARRGRVRKQ
jgi:hypothetical protein